MSPMPIGVYVCHCGLNIAGILNVDELKSFAEKLPDVVIARDLPFSCSDIGQEQIQKDIAEFKLGRPQGVEGSREVVDERRQ